MEKKFHDFINSGVKVFIPVYGNLLVLVRFLTLILTTSYNREPI